MSYPRFLLVPGLLALTACSETTAPVAPDPFDDFLLASNTAMALVDEVQALSNTAFTDIPVSGAVSFQGFGGLVIENSSETEADDIFVVGDARLTADFDDNTMTGSVTNLLAAEFAGSELLDISGEIAIGGTESFLGDDVDDNRTNRPNQWYADYAADLIIEGDTYAVEGALTGDFVGTRTAPAEGLSPIRAISAIDDQGFAVVNGAFEEVGVTFEIIAEN
jgi:hypothetical protein